MYPHVRQFETRQLELERELLRLAESPTRTRAKRGRRAEVSPRPKLALLARLART